MFKIKAYEREKKRVLKRVSDYLKKKEVKYKKNSKTTQVRIQKARDRVATGQWQSEENLKTNVEPLSATFEIISERMGNPMEDARNVGTEPAIASFAKIYDWVLVKGLATDEKEAKAIAGRIVNKIAREGVSSSRFGKKREYERTVYEEVAEQLFNVDKIKKEFIKLFK